MKTVIEFATSAEMEAARRLYPVTKPRTKPAYDDLTLRPEFQSRKFTFTKGQTCIRILPQLAGSDSWMHGIRVLTHPNGQHVHPKSLTAKNKGNYKGNCVFETAYGWLRANKPDTLYSTANRQGFRLLPSAAAICWLLVEIDGKMQARLFVGSAYDGGATGENCGIAHQLYKVASELSMPGGHDAAHTEHGSQIIVEKTTAHASKYPTYKMTRASVEAPISRYLERMDETEIGAICALQEVLRRVEPEEEWELVAKVIGEELRDEIRNATAKPQPPSPAKPEPVLLAPNESSPDEPSLVAEVLPAMNAVPLETSDDEWRW